MRLTISVRALLSIFSQGFRWQSKWLPEQQDGRFKGDDAMKILVADGDRDLVEMLTSWLKALGYEVCRAYTGERAKAEWAAQEPDLVIIDPTLKDMDGLA